VKYSIPRAVTNTARLLVGVSDTEHVGAGELRRGQLRVESAWVMAVLGAHLAVYLTDLLTDARGKEEVQAPARSVLKIAWVPQRWVGLLGRFHIEIDLGEVMKLAVAAVDRAGGETLDDDLQDLLEAFPRLGIRVAEEKVLGKPDSAADADVEPPAAQVVKHADVLDEP
jgi:hypothetical protein